MARSSARALYQDRLATLDPRAPASGVTVSLRRESSEWARAVRKRYRLLRELSTLNPHPESVAGEYAGAGFAGTPLADQPHRGSAGIGAHDRGRARILMPASMVAAERGTSVAFPIEAQSAVFSSRARTRSSLGDKLALTYGPNPEVNEDRRLFDKTRHAADACGRRADSGPRLMARPKAESTRVGGDIGETPRGAPCRN